MLQFWVNEVIWGKKWHSLCIARGEGDRTFKKLCHLGWGYQTFCQKGGITLKKGGWCRDGGLPLFYYFNVQLYLLCVAGKSKVSFITFLYYFLVLKYSIICIFLIHSDVYRECRLLYLNQFEIHRKVHLQIFLSTKEICFLILKMF